jgi:hypothetical protein
LKQDFHCFFEISCPVQPDAARLARASLMHMNLVSADHACSTVAFGDPNGNLPNYEVAHLVRIAKRRMRR